MLYQFLDFLLYVLDWKLVPPPKKKNKTISRNQQIIVGYLLSVCHQNHMVLASW